MHDLGDRLAGPDRGTHLILAPAEALGGFDDLLGPVLAEEDDAAAVGEDQVAHGDEDAVEEDRDV